MTRTTHWVLAAVLGLALVACGSKISQESYEQVRNDMSVEQVNDILGEPTEISSFGIGDLSATTAQWVGKSHTITVTFANNKVKMKSFAENSAPK